MKNPCNGCKIIPIFTHYSISHLEQSDMLRKLKADGIFTGRQLLDAAHVLVCTQDGTIVNIVHDKDAGEGVELFEGLLCPGFVNCHCHLELSHLLGQIPQHTGLVQFILHILALRSTNEATIVQAMQQAERQMLQEGIVAVGDISNLAISLAVKQHHQLYYHNFVEVSGFSPAIADTRFETAKAVFQQFVQYFPKSTSLVPHAPYSVSAKLFEHINKFNAHPLTSIHNQECADENAFFVSGEGQFNVLYQQLQVDTAHHVPTRKTSIQSVLPLLSAPEHVILVHNTCIDEKDVKWLQVAHGNKQIAYCICINANLYIENKLPPIDMLINQNVPLVVGTDSLASNATLSILSELITIHRHFAHLSLALLLQWATINGAQALGIEAQFGSFEPGKKPGILCIEGIDAQMKLHSNCSVKVIMA